MSKSIILGLGINDGGYRTTKYVGEYTFQGEVYTRDSYTCPYYSKWKNLLEEVKYDLGKPNVVSDDFRHFSDFRKWVMEHESEDVKVSDLVCLYVGHLVKGNLTSGKHNYILCNQEMAARLRRKQHRYLKQYMWVKEHSQDSDLPFYAQYAARVKGHIYNGSYSTALECHLSALSDYIDLCVIIAGEQPKASYMTIMKAIGHMKDLHAQGKPLDLRV